MEASQPHRLLAVMDTVTEILQETLEDALPLTTAMRSWSACARGWPPSASAAGRSTGSWPGSAIRCGGVKSTVPVSIQAVDDTPAEVCEVFALERGALAPGTVGLQVDEAKDLLAAVQENMVAGRPRPPRPRRRPARSAGSAPA
jgi:hypothetical protein